MSGIFFKGALTSDNQVYTGTGSITLDVKHLFTTFLQHVFSTEARYQWTKDVRTTRVLVADKNAIDLGVVEQRPSIIVSRGPLGWAYATRGQGGLGHQALQAGSTPQTLGDFLVNEREQPDYSDLIKGSVTINCISKQGLQAEEIANIVFMSLTGFKNSIYRHGIHSLTGLSIGEEQILKSTSEIELTAVPISFSYMMEKDISTSFKTADISLTYYPEEGREAELFESIHFTLTSGTRVDTLFTPAETSDLLVTYTDNDSGQIRTLVDLVGAIDGSNTQFVLPNNESAFGYFKTFSGIDFTFSGVGSIFNELPEGGE